MLMNDDDFDVVFVILIIFLDVFSVISKKFIFLKFIFISQKKFELVYFSRIEFRRLNRRVLFFIQESRFVFKFVIKVERKVQKVLIKRILENVYQFYRNKTFESSERSVRKKFIRQFDVIFFDIFVFRNLRKRSK